MVQVIGGLYWILGSWPSLGFSKHLGIEQVDGALSLSFSYLHVFLANKQIDYFGNKEIFKILWSRHLVKWGYSCTNMYHISECLLAPFLSSVPTGIRSFFSVRLILFLFSSTYLKYLKSQIKNMPTNKIPFHVWLCHSYYQ